MKVSQKYSTILFCLLLIICGCSPSTKSNEQPKSSTGHKGVSYDIQIRQPNFKPKSTASQTMYSSEQVYRIVIEDFDNRKTNRYSLVEKEQLEQDAGSFYEPEFIYRNINYYEDSDKKIPKTIKVPHNIRWHLNEFPEKYKSMETMVVDKDGEYTYDNMPYRFKNSKTGKQRVVITRVAELGKIEKEARYFQDVIKEYRMEYENQRITIHRDQGFDIAKFLNETGLNRYDLMVREL